ncbi:UvrB/UvrC motif-containing protein [Candidatus Poribacteria bacterium]
MSKQLFDVAPSLPGWRWDHGALSAVGGGTAAGISLLMRQLDLWTGSVGHVQRVQLLCVRNETWHYKRLTHRGVAMPWKDDAKSLPDKPGVYFFKSRTSEILYIGKAKSLKKRVRSYTYRSYRHSKRTRRLVRRIRSVDCTVCGSELEALLLESRLIKEHLPEFNIAQRKLRNFPFVKITMNEDFPRVFITWEIESDGAKYLGPFARLAEAGETVGLIHRLFPTRQCEKDLPTKNQKACLNYHINRCLGPCAGKVDREDYRRMVNSAIRLLSGQRDSLIRGMEKDMKEAAASLRFEKAARLRDQITGIREAIFRRQFRVNSVDNNNLIAIYPSTDADSVELFFIRKGGLVDQKQMSSPAQSDNGLRKTVMEDIEKVFFNASEYGRKPLGPLEVDAMNIISRWLYRHRDDQSLIHIRKKHNKAETITSAADKVEKVIQLLVSV